MRNITYTMLAICIINDRDVGIQKKTNFKLEFKIVLIEESNNLNLRSYQDPIF